MAKKKAKEVEVKAEIVEEIKVTSTMEEMQLHMTNAGFAYPQDATLAVIQDLFTKAFSDSDDPKPRTGDVDVEPEPERVRPRRVYEDKQDHIIIDVRVTTLDGKASSRRAKITNPTGCITRSQVNNAEGYFNTVFSGLVKKYGAGHIK